MRTTRQISVWGLETYVIKEKVGLMDKTYVRKEKVGLMGTNVTIVRGVYNMASIYVVEVHRFLRIGAANNTKNKVYS